MSINMEIIYKNLRNMKTNKYMFSHIKIFVDIYWTCTNGRVKVKQKNMCNSFLKKKK